MNLEDDFCVRLKTLRKRMGLTQAQFGALGGVLHGSQSRFEKGQQRPGLDYLLNLARAGVDYAYLMTGEPDPEDEELKRMQTAAAKLPEGERAHGVQMFLWLFAEMMAEDLNKDLSPGEAQRDPGILFHQLYALLGDKFKMP